MGSKDPVARGKYGSREDRKGKAAAIAQSHFFSGPDIPIFFAQYLREEREDGPRTQGTAPLAECLVTNLRGLHLRKRVDLRKLRHKVRDPRIVNRTE